MVTDVYSEIIGMNDNDKLLLELLKSLSPEMKEQLLKQSLQAQQ